VTRSVAVSSATGSAAGLAAKRLGRLGIVVMLPFGHARV
jgi:hypothetical protein